MANQTTNYGLTKPTLADFYDVEDQNGNMDIIDEQLKVNQTSIGKLNLKSYTSIAQLEITTVDIPSIFLAIPAGSDFYISSLNSSSAFYVANPGLPTTAPFECKIHRGPDAKNYVEITTSISNGTAFDRYYAPIVDATGVVGTWQKILSDNNLLTTIEEVTAVTAAGKGIDALVAKGLINSLSGTVITLSSTGWVTSTEYSGYKEYRVPISSIITVSPDWALFPATIVPTTAEQTAYNLVQYLVGDTEELEIVFLATTVPTINISIVVKGVII